MTAGRWLKPAAPQLIITLFGRRRSQRWDDRRNGQFAEASWVEPKDLGILVWVDVLFRFGRSPDVFACAAAEDGPDIRHRRRAVDFRRGRPASGADRR